MPVKTMRLYTFALFIADALAILAAFSLAYIVRVQFDARPLLHKITAFEYFLTFLWLLPFWLIVFWSLGLYSPRVYMRRLTEMSKVFIGSFLGILLVIGYAFVKGTPVFPARLVAVYAVVITFLFLVFGRELMRIARTIGYRYGRGVQKVMLIGNDQVAKDIAYHLRDTNNSGFRIVATCGSRIYHPSAKSFRSVDSALGSLNKLSINTIIQTKLGNEEADRKVYETALANHIGYSFIPGNVELYTGKNTMDVFLGYPFISVYQTPLIGWGETVKRIFDLVLVTVTSPIWGLLIILIAILQKILNPGPIFYKSLRLTRYSRAFQLLKFRSMGKQYGKKDAAEEFKDMGRDDLAKEYKEHHKVEDDPRITWFGGFLRTTSLDELPQLINVLKGDLSLVGPRPILPQEVKFSPNRTALLHSVKSGVTGLWQVSGRSNLSFEERIELELFYAQNWSFNQDLRILFKTIGVVLFGKGAK